MLLFFANVFGCKVWKLPFKHLGFPLCLGLQKKRLLDSIVEQIDKKLSSWKGRYLSMGGHITLIKSVLSSILFTFFLVPNVLKVFT